MKKHFYIYILRSFNGVFYVGITSNLTKRLYEHKNKLIEGFTSKNNVDKLVYYEVYNDAENAILREKQLKNWNRKKKVELIAKSNPQFQEITIESLV